MSTAALELHSAPSAAARLPGRLARLASASRRLDLVSVGPRSRFSLLATLNQMRDGSHVGRPGVALWQASSVRIATGGRSPTIADTTNLGADMVELTVQRHALELVTR